MPRFELDAPQRRRVRQATVALVAVGIVLRLVRYLLCFPLWGDEAFVAASFLDRGYGGMIEPLEYHQVCPPLFMWVELTFVRLFGFSEYGLRLAPCLASIAALLLFWRFASRALRGVPLLLAVGIFAVAYYPIRHGGEVKPYATDLFASTLLLTLFAEWWFDQTRSRWLWVLAAVAPAMVWLSYPAVFVAGGLGLAIAWTAWQSRLVSARWATIVYGLALVTAFLGLLRLTASGQYEREFVGHMGDYWHDAFPPLTEPLSLVVWLVREHTGFAFAYPVGGENGASALTFICFVVGAWVLWRHRRRALCLALLAPFALALVAAAMQRYPYGHSARVMLYLAPPICLLMGLGGAALLAAGPIARWRRTGVAISAGVLLVLGAAQATRDLVQPYKTIYDQNDRAFAYWLWNDKAHGVEMVCVWADLGQDFFPSNWDWGHSARYRCNQRIYSPRHAHGGHPPDWDKVTAERPLVCVVYWVGDLPRDEAKFARWMGDLEQRFALADRERHRLNPGSGYDETYELLTFVPRADEEIAVANGSGPTTR